MMLLDTLVRVPSDCELYILLSRDSYKVARIVRDIFHQAILPIDDTFKSDGELIDLLDNEHVRALIAVLGVGIDYPRIQEYPDLDYTVFEISKLRYHKVIIARQDTKPGERIEKKLLKFFSLYMTPLITNGHVYVLESPIALEVTQAEFTQRVLDPLTRRLVQVSDTDPRIT